jgi:hypothetical protein
VSPATASFGGRSVIDEGAGQYLVQGHVDAQNRFGAKLRNYFHVRIKFVGDKTWQVVDGPLMSEKQEELLLKVWELGQSKGARSARPDTPIPSSSARTRPSNFGRPRRIAEGRPIGEHLRRPVTAAIAGQTRPGLRRSEASSGARRHPAVAMC